MSESEIDAKRLGISVDEWLAEHKNETFLPDDIFKFYDWRESKTKKAVYNHLGYLVRKDPPLVERDGKYFRVIDREVEIIRWWDGEKRPPFNLKFPYGIPDNSHFGFVKNVTIHEGDLIVVAGRSNQGKTTFCLNVMSENIDNHPVRYQTSEFNKAKFEDRISHFDLEHLFKDGVPKFELVKMKRNYRYAIIPTGINILDWISLPDKFWQIEDIEDDLKKRVTTGIIVIVLQKSPGKEYGTGGDWGERYADLYLTLDPGKLTVKKAKSWNGVDPNLKMYGFRIVDSGSKFEGIKEVKNCPKCKGYGTSYGKECDVCYGKGYLDKEGMEWRDE